MDTLDFSVLVALITPIYVALFAINRKIGKYDQVCREVREMEDELNQLWIAVTGG